MYDERKKNINEVITSGNVSFIVISTFFLATFKQITALFFPIYNFNSIITCLISTFKSNINKIKKTNKQKTELFYCN